MDFEINNIFVQITHDISWVGLWCEGEESVYWCYYVLPVWRYIKFCYIYKTKIKKIKLLRLLPMPSNSGSKCWFSMCENSGSLTIQTLTQINNHTGSLLFTLFLYQNCFAPQNIGVHTTTSSILWFTSIFVKFCFCFSVQICVCVVGEGLKPKYTKD